MNRLMIGKDGDTVSARTADDWLESRDDTASMDDVIELASATAADERLEGSPPVAGVPIGVVTRSAGKRSPRRTRQRRALVLAAALTLLVAAIVTGIIFTGNDPGLDRAGSAPTPSPPAGAGATTPATPPARATDPAAAPTVALPSRGRLWSGDRGRAVERLQAVLVTLGLEPGSVDGRFGRQTRGAVVAFQRSQGLEPDGIVGPKTAVALNAAVADRRD